VSPAPAGSNRELVEGPRGPGLGFCPCRAVAVGYNPQPATAAVRAKADHHCFFCRTARGIKTLAARACSFPIQSPSRRPGRGSRSAFPSLKELTPTSPLVFAPRKAYTGAVSVPRLKD
jgi:hypothetical protein